MYQTLSSSNRYHSAIKVCCKIKTGEFKPELYIKEVRQCAEIGCWLRTGLQVLSQQKGVKGSGGQKAVTFPSGNGEECSHI